MDYIKLSYLDFPVSIFSVCQAHAQLEADYNRGGILLERPSNKRRNASTGWQLARMKFTSGLWWVDILSDGGDPADDEVRDIYLMNVLKWNLPMADDMREFIRNRYTPEFLNQFLGLKSI
jgi:hypothetical protein